MRQRCLLPQGRTPRPELVSCGEQAGSGSRRARKAQVHLRKSRLAVVHVVQDLVVRAPQKYHAPLTITVNRGSLRSVKNSDRPASICKGAGRGVGPLFFAKVRVAGSNPVVRSRESPGSFTSSPGLGANSTLDTPCHDFPSWAAVRGLSAGAAWRASNCQSGGVPLGSSWRCRI